MSGTNWNAKQLHKDMILALLLHHMSPETRQMLMLEAPAAYNDVCGFEVVRVHRVSSGDPVIPGVFPVTRITFGGDS